MDGNISLIHGLVGWQARSPPPDDLHALYHCLYVGVEPLLVGRGMLRQNPIVRFTTTTISLSSNVFSLTVGPVILDH